MRKIAIVLLGLTVLITDIYLFPKDDDCSAIDNVKEQKICLENKAFSKLDPLYCDKFSSEDEYGDCILTLVGRGIESKTLTPEVCLNIKGVTHKNDCISHYSLVNKDLAVCTLIETKEEQLHCLGEIKRIFTLEEEIKSADICTTLQKHGHDLWHDSCMLAYVRNNDIQKEASCKSIKTPLAYYDCVKNIGLNKKDSNICTHVNERMPFPANFPDDIFSEKGCRYWVEHEGSYKGIPLNPNR